MAQPALILSRGRVAAISAPLARLLGIPGGNGSAQSEAIDFMAARQPAHVSRRIAEAVATGADFIEFPMVAADGSAIMLSGVPIKAEWNRRRVVLVTVRAAAQRAETAARQRIQTNKMAALGSLAEGVAHELNNLLQPITLLAELALQGLAEDSCEAEYLRRTVVASDSAREMVQRILVFGRADRPSFERMEVAELVREAIDFVRLMLPSSISVCAEVPGNVGTVYGDKTQFTQMLMNLASNARDAIGSRVGELSIGLRRVDLAVPLPQVSAGAVNPGAYAAVTVRDSGIGMNRRTMRRIFDPFFTTKAAGEGIGLGLSVTRAIVIDHGGAIRVDSKPSLGTAFTIYLPIIEPALPML